MSNSQRVPSPDNRIDRIHPLNAKCILDANGMWRFYAQPQQGAVLDITTKTVIDTILGRVALIGVCHNPGSTKPINTAVYVLDQEGKVDEFNGARFLGRGFRHTILYMLLNPVDLDDWKILPYDDAHEAPAVSHRRAFLSELDMMRLAFSQRVPNSTS